MSSPSTILPDPFNVADSRVLDHVGKTVRLLLATYRYELVRRDAVAKCLSAARGMASQRGKAEWALDTMAKHPARLPLGAETSSSDAEVFACCWFWADEIRFSADGSGNGMKVSLIGCLDDVVTDKLEWTLGALCRAAHFTQALAGFGSDEDEIYAGASTFQLNTNHFLT